MEMITLDINRRSVVRTRVMVRSQSQLVLVSSTEEHLWFSRWISLLQWTAAASFGCK